MGQVEKRGQGKSTGGISFLDSSSGVDSPGHATVAPSACSNLIVVTYKLQSTVMEVRRYVTSSGRDVVGEWLAALKDVRTRAKILARIESARRRKFRRLQSTARRHL